MQCDDNNIHTLQEPPDLLVRLRRASIVLCMVAIGHDKALRLFSVIQDQQSRELSQKHTAKRAKQARLREEELKLPHVIAMASCQVCQPLRLYAAAPLCAIPERACFQP